MEKHCKLFYLFETQCMCQSHIAASFEQIKIKRFTDI